MTNIPIIDKRNYKKVLRELNVSSYPSLPKSIIDWHDRLKNKVIPSEIDGLILYNKLVKYFRDYRQELNKQYADGIDWDLVKLRPPMPYQKDGIKFLILNSKCILADDMGLGKSLQSIIAAKFLPDDYKILVITKNTLKYNFEIEIKYYDKRVTVIKDANKWKTSKFTIVHYAQLKKLQNNIIDTCFDIIICDECHFLKHPQAQRSKYALHIFEKAKKEIKYIWLLTGTPISNRPIEYFNLLRIIKHPLAKNYFNYIIKYCNGYKDYFGHWQVNGSSNEEDLYDKVRSVVLRRKKEDVLKDLPQKERIPIFIDFKNRDKYDKCIKEYEKKKSKEIENEFITYNLPFKYHVPKIAEMMIKRNFCALEKIRDNSLVELIENDLDVDDNNKIVIFTNFTSVIDEVYSKFTDKICRIIDGRIKVEDRVSVCTEFNENSSLRLMAVNIEVGAEGLNLQSANIGIINDMHLVPMKMSQVEDRLHRLGQKRAVTIKYPIYKDSIEENVFEMITKKMKIISKVIDNKEQAFFNEELVNAEDNNSILKDLFDKIDKIS